MKILSGREVREILNRHGFSEVRRRGSHVLMQKRMLDNSTLTVPVPDHKELRRGTLLSIIRQSGLTKSEFET